MRQLVVLIMVIMNISAKDLGTFGETFPIQEKSFLDVIKSKLQGLFESGQLEYHHQKITHEVQQKIIRPHMVGGIRKTISSPRTFEFDPSITVPYDLKDHNGMVFQIKGTRVNPLDTHPLRCSLLFLDGDNFNHVSWATNLWMTAPENSKPKLILVNGSPFELSQKHNLPVYFDQAGVLIKKLGIRQVPARVSQKNKILLVEEIEESVLQVDQTINLKENDQ